MSHEEIIDNLVADKIMFEWQGDSEVGSGVVNRAVSKRMIDL